MTDLIEFLTARLDEDEAIAKAAAPGRWRLDSEGEDLDPTNWDYYSPDIITDPYSYPVTHYVGRAADGSQILSEGTDTSVYVAQAHYDSQSSTTVYTLENSAHIVRHAPQRVLAEIAAKRAVLKGYDSSFPTSPWLGCGDDCEWKVLEWVFRCFAAPYSGHPDYQQEWAC